MTKGKTQPIDETLELSQREIIALEYIIDYIRNDRFHRPPTQKELLEHLNKVLPKRNGKPALVSTQQTHRIASRLRLKGYLVALEEDEAVTHRNMMPTEAGRRFIQRREHSTHTSAQ